MLGLGHPPWTLIAPPRGPRGPDSTKYIMALARHRSALVPTDAVNCPLTSAGETVKPGCYLEPPLLGTGKPLKEARKEHSSAWTEEVTSRQTCRFCVCVFVVFFFFDFLLF